MADSGILEIRDGAVPASPAVNYHRIFVDSSDGIVKKKNSSGVVTNLSGGVITVGTIDSQTPDADGLVIVGTEIYAQSASDTDPGLVNNTTQTFSGNKTFNGKLISNAANYDKVVALVDAALIATDASLGNIFTVTLAGNRTLQNPTNPTDGQKCVWRIKQDGTGSRTLALDTSFRLGSDLSFFILSTTANKVDYMGAIYNGSDSRWDIVAFMRGY